MQVVLERLEGTQKQMENAQKELQASNTANSTLNSKYRQVESDSHSLRLQLGEAQDELQAAKGQIRDLEESLRQSSLNQKVSRELSVPLNSASDQINSVTEHYTINAIPSSSLINCADGGSRC